MPALMCPRLDTSIMILKHLEPIQSFENSNPPGLGVPGDLARDGIFIRSPSRCPIRSRSLFPGPAASLALALSKVIPPRLPLSRRTRTRTRTHFTGQGLLLRSGVTQWKERISWLNPHEGTVISKRTCTMTRLVAQ